MENSTDEVHAERMRRLDEQLWRDHERIGELRARLQLADALQRLLLDDRHNKATIAYAINTVLTHKIKAD